MAIRWALLGLGRHAERSVLPQMQEAKGTELVAVLSRDRARGEVLAQKYGIAKVFTALDELLRDRNIDAVYDATPDGLHAQHAIAAAKAGKHALIEKPLAISVRDGVEAIAASRRYGTRLGVVFNQRHEAVHQEARRLVLDGAIGESRLASVQIALRAATPRTGSAATTWRTDPKLRAGGIVVSIGDHAHDTLSFLVGQEIEAVSGFSDASSSDRPDERVVGMVLRLSRGAIGYAAASFATPFARRPFEIHGTRGSLVIENSYAYLTGAGEDATPTLTLENDAGRIVRRVPATDCFRLEVEQFNRAIEGKDEPMTPPEQGLRAVAIGEALYDAIKTARIVQVADYLPRPA